MIRTLLTVPLLFVILFSSMCFAADIESLRISLEAQKKIDEQKNDEAAKLLENALQKNPNDFLLHYSNSRLYFARRDWQKVLSEINESIRLNPDFVESYRLRARLYQVRGHDREACTDYRKYLKAVPFHAISWRMLGVSQLSIGDYKAALESLQKEALLDPDNEMNIYLTSAICFYSGDMYKAMKTLDAMDKLSENPDENHKHLRESIQAWTFILLMRDADKDKLREYKDSMREKIDKDELSLENLIFGETEDSFFLKDIERKTVFEQSDIYYNLGQKHLIRKNRERAKEYFIKVLQVGLMHMTQHYFSKAELRLLGLSNDEIEKIVHP